MKKETEATLMAVHYQTMTTNAVKIKIYKQQYLTYALDVQRKREIH